MDTQTAYEGIRAHFSNPDTVFGYDTTALRCVYRGADSDGRPSAASPVRCAVGCILPDEAWSESTNSSGVAALLLDNAVAKGFFLDTDTKFLSDAQQLHDGIAEKPVLQLRDSDDPYSLPYKLLKQHFVSKLDKLAADYGLTVVA